MHPGGPVDLASVSGWRRSFLRCQDCQRSNKLGGIHRLGETELEPGAQHFRLILGGGEPSEQGGRRSSPALQ